MSFQKGDATHLVCSIGCTDIYATYLYQYWFKTGSGVDFDIRSLMSYLNIDESTELPSVTGFDEFNVFKLMKGLHSTNIRWFRAVAYELDRRCQTFCEMLEEYLPFESARVSAVWAKHHEEAKALTDDDFPF